MDESLLDRFIGDMEDVWSPDKWSETTALERNFAAYDTEIENIHRTRLRVVVGLDTAAARIKKCRNCLPPVNRLPVELHRYVFELAGQRGLDFRTTLAMTSVCALWRAVALDNASMWTHPSPYASDSYWTLAIERSKSMPLVLLATHDISQARLSLVNVNSHRLHTLHLTLPTFPLPEADVSLLGKYSPLEELALDFTHSPPHIRTLPSPNLPNLRRLEVTHCWFEWSSGAYRNLTHVTIALDSPHNLPPNSSSDIMVIFLESPELESVTLGLPASWDPPVTHRERLSMNRLRSISLTASPPLLLYILRSIDTPSLDSFSAFTNSPMQRNMQFVHTLFDMKSLPFPRLHELVITHEDDVVRLRSAASHEKEDASLTPDSFAVTDPYLHITLRLPPANLTQHSYVDHTLMILSNVPMPLLRYLGFSTTYHIPDHLADLSPACGVSGILSLLSSQPTVSSFTFNTTVGAVTGALVDELHLLAVHQSLWDILPSLRHCRLSLSLLNLAGTQKFKSLVDTILSNAQVETLRVELTAVEVWMDDGVNDLIQWLRSVDARRLLVGLCRVVRHEPESRAIVRNLSDWWPQEEDFPW